MNTRSASTARRRGAETQHAVAAYLADNGWPYATDCGAGRSGCDILNTPGLAFEIKARTNFSPLAWVRQAIKNGQGGLPLCVVRPNGLGLTSIGAWPTILLLDDAITVLRTAGYGDPIDDVPVLSRDIS